MYSMLCNRASGRVGNAISTTCPERTMQPLTMQMRPPTATISSGSSMKGRISCSNESWSRSESASTAQKSGKRERFMPALSASDLPPLALSTTSRRG